jgi:hypothetical protein
MLQNPPTWSLSPKAKADWVLKQHIRQDLGLNTTSQKGQRKKAQYSHSNSAVMMVPKTTEPWIRRTKLLLWSTRTIRNQIHAIWQAVIAAGYRPGPEVKAVRRRQRRRLASGMAMGMLSLESLTNNTNRNRKPKLLDRVLSSRHLEAPRSCFSPTTLRPPPRILLASPLPNLTRSCLYLVGFLRIIISQCLGVLQETFCLSTIQ